LPNGLKGEAIVPAVRVVALAQDIVLFQRIADRDAAIAIVRARRGKAYDPHLSDLFIQHASQICADSETEPTWDRVLALEPAKRRMLSADEFDQACQTLADFVDIKCSYTLGHSRGVALLAEKAAQHCGLPANDIRDLRHAGFLHDLGRAAVSTGIWSKSAALTSREWQQIRLHPYHTEQILARPAYLQHLGNIASMHHERLDGSGYHRNLSATQISLQARLLAAADVFQALTETRPHRPAYPAAKAATILQREAHAGRLDPDAVAGVLQAAGRPHIATRRQLVAGLSEREIEVLRLVARGQSIREIAATLIIAPKTVDNHIQHIYAKIGVTTRAGATLFAIEHHLV
jgi:HD-GYP domain-containing protein (c-di-GMP phosphodiesterase class II)